MKENLFIGFIVLAFVAIFIYLLTTRSSQNHQDVRNWCDGQEGLVQCSGRFSAENGDKVVLGNSYIPKECASGLTWDGSACKRNGEIPNDLYGVGCSTC